MRAYNPNKTQDTCFLGTRGYAAPEQFGGYGQTDARTDIYCLGMTMYHLLTELDPVNRYQSCAELKNDLNNYQNLPPKQRLFSKLFNK